MLIACYCITLQRYAARIETTYYQRCVANQHVVLTISVV